MKNRSKKIAAALAAVEAYMQEEYAAAAQTPAPPPGVEPTAWALSARLDTMTGHRMMQFRAFSNIR
ncbi:MAG: hypothetical protein LBL72_11690 [Candidatus Accumulibacter sp.]|jgi:hypothetical protein|nr:hypothetical protein [Accumulibacter sp.]